MENLVTQKRNKAVVFVDIVNATMEKRIICLNTTTSGLQDWVKRLTRIVTRRAKIWIYLEVIQWFSDIL